MDAQCLGGTMDKDQHTHAHAHALLRVSGSQLMYSRHIARGMSGPMSLLGQCTTRQIFTQDSFLMERNNINTILLEVFAYTIKLIVSKNNRQPRYHATFLHLQMTQPTPDFPKASKVARVTWDTGGVTLYPTPWDASHPYKGGPLDIPDQE